jgi:L-cysteine/cystine lyase
MIEQEKIDLIRTQFPAVLKQLYFNTGTYGPLPERGYQALADYSGRQFEEGRLSRTSSVETQSVFTLARQAVAKLLECEIEEIALTHSTTEGMNIAIMGLDWKRGDEVVTSITEHPGGLFPVYLLKQRYGVKIRQTEIGKPGINPLDELRRVLTSKTRAVVLSHVVWSSGIVLPLREIADLVHQAGAFLLCDGAQSGGMVPAKVYELGVDAYALSGQKWLCGPGGTGALFIRKAFLSNLSQTFAALPNFKASDYDGNFVPTVGVRRYEAISQYPPAVKAQGIVLDWLDQEVGWEWIYERIARLGQYCHERLSILPGVKIYTPRDNMAGLVHFSLDGITASKLVAELSKKEILVRSLPDSELIRISTGFYNTEEEIDRLILAIEAILKEESV